MTQTEILGMKPPVLELTVVIRIMQSRPSVSLEIDNGNVGKEVTVTLEMKKMLEKGKTKIAENRQEYTKER